MWLIVPSRKRLRDGVRPLVGDGSKDATASWKRAQQTRHADQRLVGQRPWLLRLDRRLAVDEAQHLAPVLVAAEEARRAVEPDPLEVHQKRASGRRRRPPRAPHGVADPHDSPSLV